MFNETEERHQWLCKQVMSLSDCEYNSAPRDYNATARDYNATYKILVLGESGVGKTSLIRRFVENKFKESYLSTIGKFWKDTYYWKCLYVECQIKPLWGFPAPWSSG